MAYKFNPITGKMDMVNSVEEISDSVTITGETFEKHGNLKPQVLDHKPVSEVMAEILFTDYAPIIATALANRYAYAGESVVINGITWNVGKRTNPLASFLAQSIGDNTIEELIAKTFSESEKNLKTQDVSYAGTLTLTANHTIKARVTDEQGLFAEIERAVRFPYPIIVGAFNNTNLAKIVINYNSGVYELSAYDDNNNPIVSNQLSAYKYEGNGTITCQINTNDTTPLACVIARGNTFKKFVQKGATDTPISLSKLKSNVTVEFQISGVQKWSINDFALNATTDTFTQPYTAAVTFEPKY